MFHETPCLISPLAYLQLLSVMLLLRRNIQSGFSKVNFMYIVKEEDYIILYRDGSVHQQSVFYLSINMYSINLSINLSTYLSTYLYFYISIYLSINLFFYLTKYLSI